MSQIIDRKTQLWFIIIGILLLVGFMMGVESPGIWRGRNMQREHIQSPTPVSSPSSEVVCTLDAKQCPDGSYVGRVGANCEFAACPSPKPPSARE